MRRREREGLCLGFTHRGGPGERAQQPRPAPVQGSHLKGEVGHGDRLRAGDNGKWRRDATKTLGGDAVVSLWAAAAVWVNNTLLDSH